MTEINLFPHIDTAFRVIALLALCVLPFVVPMPAAVNRAVQALRQRKTD